MISKIAIFTTAALALAASAFAQPVGVSGSFSAAERASNEAFWTNSMLANAKPMALPEVDPATVVPGVAANPGPARSLPGGLPSVTLTSESLASESIEMQNHGDTSVSPEGFSYVFPYSTYRPPVVNAYPYAAIGKLFFFVPPGYSIASGEYVCSGSVDNNNHTVLTARHCVYDTGVKKFYTNFIFYPGYNSGPNPTYHNGWTARKIETWATPTTLGEFDLAFIQLFDSVGSGCGGSTGNPIGHYTGWLGSTWNGNYSQRQWEVFGYPQSSPFDGNHLIQTSAATGVLNPLGVTNEVEVGSNQTGGTSGGPWIIGLDPLNATDPSPNNNVTTGTNLANGVNSFKFTSPSQPLAINGPEFLTANFLNLYNLYLALSCP